MAYTNINKPSNYFNTKLFTANASTQSITGVGFQPDMVWGKSRTDAFDHEIYDVVRGVYKRIKTNQTQAEASDVGNLTSFDADGFSLGSQTNMNYTNGASIVSWNWLGGGTGVSNTDGSITSTVSANQTSGFSIVKWSGTSSNATIGHGLGTAPKVIIAFGYSSGGNSWTVGHHSLGWTKSIYLETGSANGPNSTFWQDTAPTNNVFSVGSFVGTNSSQSMIAYCFAEKKGFSKFGSYVGNASATDNAFIYCGFKPAFFLSKCSSISGDRWTLYDNKRDPYNSVYRRLFPDGNIAESGNVDADIDFTSTGVKIRTDAGTSGAAQTYIYMAFAEHPLVSSTGVPCTAR